MRDGHHEYAAVACHICIVQATVVASENPNLSAASTHAPHAASTLRRPKMMGREAAADLDRIRRTLAQKYRQICQIAARECGTEYGLGSWAEKRPHNWGRFHFPLAFTTRSGEAPLRSARVCRPQNGPELWAALSSSVPRPCAITRRASAHDPGPKCGPRTRAAHPRLRLPPACMGETSGGDHACGGAQETHNWGGVCAGRLAPISATIQLVTKDKRTAMGWGIEDDISL